MFSFTRPEDKSILWQRVTPT